MNKMIRFEKNLLIGRLILFLILFVILIILPILFEDEIQKELKMLFVFCSIVYFGFILYTIYKIFQPVTKIVEEQKSIITGRIKRLKEEIENLEKKLKSYDNN